MSALLFEKEGHIVTLTINRPDARNPLGEEGDGRIVRRSRARASMPIAMCAAPF